MIIAIVAAGALLLILTVLMLILYRRLQREIRENRATFLRALGTAPKKPDPPNGGQRGLRSIPGGKAAGVALITIGTWLRDHLTKIVSVGGIVAAVATVALVASIPIGREPYRTPSGSPSGAESAPTSYPPSSRPPSSITTSSAGREVLAAGPPPHFTPQPTGVAAERTVPTSLSAPRPTLSTNTLASSSTSSITETESNSCLIGIQALNLLNICVY